MVKSIVSSVKFSRAAMTVSVIETPSTYSKDDYKDDLTLKTVF